MDTRQRTHRVSGRQIDMLWEFLIINKDIATGYNRSLQAKEYSQRKWREVAELLNSEGGGVHKDWKGWSKYWVDFKAKLKSKVAAIRSSQSQTGGGPSTEKRLTEIEEKFLQIVGEDFGQGLPGVRVEPFSEPHECGTAPASVINFPSQSISTYNEPVNLLPTPPIVPHPSVVQDPPVVEDPLIIIPQRTPSPIPITVPAAAVRSPRRRRLRREPPISQEAARRSIVTSVQQYASAMERIAETCTNMAQSLQRIERMLYDAFARAAERESAE